MIKLIFPFRYWLLLGITCTAIASATQPALAYIMKPLIDKGFDGRDPSLLWIIPVAIIGLFLARGVFSFCSTYIIAWIANNILVNLRTEMFDRLLVLPDDHFQRVESGRLLNRFTGDCARITGSVTTLFTTIVREFFVVTSIFVLLLYLSWKLTLVIIAILPLLLFVTKMFSSQLRTIGRDQIDVNADYTAVIRETIDGQREIKLFQAQEQESKRFWQINRHLLKVAMRTASSVGAITPLTQLVIALGVAVVMFIAMHQSMAGTLTVGAFVAFATALVQIFDPIKRLTSLSADLQMMLASAESVFSLLDEPAEKNEGTIQSLPSQLLNITFDHVSYQYPHTEQKALHNFTLQIEAGQTVAFVGRSGSGKTTLVNTLPRFIAIDQGTIRFNDMDIHDIELNTLRRHISYVSQRVVLFQGTIAQNVGYGYLDKISEADIYRALEQANLLDFVRQLPDGIHTMIGENGSRLSGGQRQRLVIARALIKNAPILILDEATSALDNESERLVQESLNTLMQGRTTLVIAHRLSTIQHADKIVVIDQGQIVEMGTHQELLDRDQLYASLYRMQFSV